MRSFHQLLLLAALVATTSTALAQDRGSRGGGPGFAPSGAMLLGQKSVQKDLKLNDDQIKQVEEFAAKQRDGQSGLRDASREERTKRFTEIREAGQKAIDTILNDEQQARLKQISLQLAGPAALASPEVAEQLAFTDEQKKSIEEIQSASREAMRSLMQDADGDRAEAFKKMQATRQATEEKVKALLTDEQKTKWEALIGKKLEGQLEGPGGRGQGRGRRGNQDANLRRENDTTVLTADKSNQAKSDEGKSDEVKADKVKADKKDHAKPDRDQEKARHKRGGSNKHAKHAKHRQHGEHAARKHGRGSHVRHAPHRRGHDRHSDARHAQHRRGPEHALAHRGPHRHPHARFAHHGRRPQSNGRLHGPHFAHRGPQSRHHQGPGHHFGPGLDARRQAWNRVALAMGGQHGSRSFSHAGPRHHGHRGPHHFAHRGPGERHRHHVSPPNFAARGWRGPGQGYHGQQHARSHQAPMRGHFASDPRGPRPGHNEHRLSGSGGPGRPNFAWHIDRQREDGPGMDREHGPRSHRPRMYPAGFQRRPHEAREQNRSKNDGDRKPDGAKRHGQSERDHKAGEKHKDHQRNAEKSKDSDKKASEKKDD